MPAIEQPKFAELVQQTRARIELSQIKFASKLGVSFHSVNRWENERARPLPLAFKQTKVLLHQMGDHGKDLLEKYFQG
ncbi:helix-turn-helix domain-containing protein [Chlorogloeopsis fritschii PCC 9212]|uniref:HTH cro/C1-type domain-containing protein n=1 Tax=Chlorogloeopsis fritschii PCC 6912 TaxID=211165 RepID=A0A3S1A4P0_CHLFR|nr:transcriptional regulator [Chlorogloeopsis fritschii]RUR80159.1 hypothetical protein PCC6912_30190 [Chlorogloeopsis fritschii PCC 6912]